MTTKFQMNTVDDVINSVCEETRLQATSAKWEEGMPYLFDLMKLTEEKPKPKTKRSPTGYIMYGNSVREEVKIALGEGAKPQAVMTEIARLWKATDQSVRDQWKEEAKVAWMTTDLE